jgi:hypothetical protein
MSNLAIFSAPPLGASDDFFTGGKCNWHPSRMRHGVKRPSASVVIF